MQSDDIFRPFGDAADLVDVQCGCIGGKDRARLHDPVQVGEYFLLQVHVFKDGLNDEVTVCKVFHIQSARQAGHTRLDFVLRKPSLVGAALIMATNYTETTIKGFLLLLQYQHRNTHRGEIH
jgi:hypothetical protein